MSLEQAKGRPADKRSDVWAFGAVLYEMLTGKRAFEGEDMSDTLANVLKSEPNWSALPSDVPTVIRVWLKRCLQKDRGQRIGDIAAALFVLHESANLAGGTHREGPAAFDSAQAREAGPHGGRAVWRRVSIPASTAHHGAQRETRHRCAHRARMLVHLPHRQRRHARLRTQVRPRCWHRLDVLDGDGYALR